MSRIYADFAALAEISKEHARVSDVVNTVSKTMPTTDAGGASEIVTGLLRRLTDAADATAKLHKTVGDIVGDIATQMETDEEDVAHKLNQYAEGV